MEVVLRKIRYTLELVKFSHTIFALPFALAAFLVASLGNFQMRALLWTVLCVLLARTSAMAFNRWVDARYDAANPRTKSRHLPAGFLSKPYVIALTMLSGTGFILAASQINSLALMLSPICLFFLYFYSLTKRFTHFTQFFLGLSLGMAPVGAAIAARGTWDWNSLILGAAVLLWVAGFDLLYSLQDLDFDRASGLHSLAVKLGVKRTFQLSALLHLGFLGMLAWYGIAEALGKWYWMGFALTAGFLIWEHVILKEDLKKIQAAFFTANGLLSLSYLLFVVLDVWSRL